MPTPRPIIAANVDADVGTLVAAARTRMKVSTDRQRRGPCRSGAPSRMTEPGEQQHDDGDQQADLLRRRLGRPLPSCQRAAHLGLHATVAALRRCLREPRSRPCRARRHRGRSAPPRSRSRRSTRCCRRRADRHRSHVIEPLTGERLGWPRRSPRVERAVFDGEHDGTAAGLGGERLLEPVGRLLRFAVRQPEVVDELVVLLARYDETESSTTTHTTIVRQVPGAGARGRASDRDMMDLPPDMGRAARRGLTRAREIRAVR